MSHVLDILPTMSPTSTPTDLFQHLSLNPQMSPTSDQVRTRAAEIRDVLSSFDREILPAEFRTDTFERLDRPVVSRPQMQSEWTVQQDLVATLLQWGCYDDQAYEFITRIQPPSTRTRLFHEKLNRRISDIFHNYDILHGTVSTSQEAHNEVQALADTFIAVVEAVHEDRQYRELGHPRTAQLVLDALVGICHRNEDIMLSDLNSPASERSSTATAPLRSDMSLFQILIRNSDQSKGGTFIMLDLLDSYPPTIIGQLKSGFRQLSDLLNSNGAPKAFMKRTLKLLAIAEEHAPPEAPEEEVAEPSSAASAGSRAARTEQSASTEGKPEQSASTENRAGSKRSAADQGSSKRGRKKTSK